MTKREYRYTKRKKRKTYLFAYEVVSSGVFMPDGNGGMKYYEIKNNIK